MSTETYLLLRDAEGLAASLEAKGMDDDAKLVREMIAALRGKS